MDTTSTLGQHYAQILGLEEPWVVTGVELDTDGQKLIIRVSTPKRTKLPCPECKKLCAKEDHREERTWRHLDTMQFETLIKCRIPRVNCGEHGILSADVPWSDSFSRFTLLFERFAIDVLLVARSIKSAKGLLRISWDQVHEFCGIAVIIIKHKSFLSLLRNKLAKFIKIEWS